MSFWLSSLTVGDTAQDQEPSEGAGELYVGPACIWGNEHSPAWSHVRIGVSRAHSRPGGLSLRKSAQNETRERGRPATVTWRRKRKERPGVRHTNEQPNMVQFTVSKTRL